MASHLPRPSWHETARPLAVVWILLALVLVFACYFATRQLAAVAGAAAFFAEDGPVETLQAGLVGVAGLMFLLGFRRSGDAKAIFCLGMAVAMGLAMQREIPNCASAYYDEGVCLPATGKAVFVGLLFVGALICLATKRPRLWSFFDPRNLLWAWPAGISLAMLLLAEVAEHRLAQDMEELLELAAYLHLLAFSVWTARLPARHSCLFACRA